MTQLERSIAQCVAHMGMLKYFPSDEFARAGIMRMIRSMATDPTQVEWLGASMVRHFNEWPGPLALRAMFSQRWQPADGVSADMQGFGGTMEAEIEQRALSTSEEFKRLTESGRQTLHSLMQPERFQIEAAAADAVTEIDPNQQRRAEQHERWKTICRVMPAMIKNLPRLSTEFAATEDLDRREEILKRLEKAAIRI